MKITRTNSNNKDFIELVKLLDEDLAVRDGNEHAFYNQFNSIDSIKYAVVVYENDIAIGCGAIKKYNSNLMEIKRMYVLPKKRGKGIASEILIELEKWAKELTYKKCILETGKKQPEAIKLYLKAGYNIIPNYGQYKNVGNSVCFEKLI